MDKLLSPFHQSKILNTLFWVDMFINFHYALIIYVNSSLLSQFFTQTQVSALYIIASILNVALLLCASKITRFFGIYRFTILAISVELISTICMTVGTSAALTALGFIGHTVAITLLLFNMDIFLESLCTDESKTGSIRATYLTLANVTIILAPPLVALLLVHNVYSYVYFTASIMMIPVYYLVKQFKNVDKSVVKPMEVKQTVLGYLRNKDLYNAFSAEFLLQLFYSFMVIYTPVYLNKYIGFSWPEIGAMFTIMLVPFIIFEMPVGDMEDGKYTEKEFLTIGFVIMGLATLFISFITLKNFWIWTVVLFVTRIGASLVEVSVESYFFKRVNQEKTDTISFFRVARPLSYIAAAVLATVSLQFIPFQYIFIVIGACMVFGTHYSLTLTDTRLLSNKK